MFLKILIYSVKNTNLDSSAIKNGWSMPLKHFRQHSKWEIKTGINHILHFMIGECS